MSETYQIVFVRAGDGSPSAKKSVAEKIANATKTPVERMLKQIEAAPFIYKKGLPRSKAEAIAATLNKFGAQTEVNPEPGTSDAASASAPGFGGAGDPAAASSGFGFGAATPTPSSGGFGFGASAPPASGGFGLAEDFKIEQPSGEFGAPSPGGGGFNFSAEAAISAPAAKAPLSEVAVERNADFTPTTPTVKHTKKSSQGSISCPRCGHEQPPANECASCGVVMSKAGTGDATLGAPRRPRAKVAAVEKKSNLVPALVALLVAAVAAGGAYIAGAFNPILLSMAVSREPLLKAYGVSVKRPSPSYVTAVVGDPAKAKELQDGFIARSQAIDAAISGLEPLSDVAQFDQAEQALRPEIEAYRTSSANEVIEHTRTAVAPYYQVKAIGLTLDGKTYMDQAGIELSGASGVAAVLNEVQIRQRLKDAREKVAAAATQRLEAERRQSVNVSFADGFDAALGERWQGQGEVAGGHLRVTSAPAQLPQGPRVAIAEPVSDYVAEVRVMGSAADGSRGGLVLYQDDQNYVGVVKSRARSGETAQVLTQGGDGYSAPLGRDVRFRIEKKGPYYTFHSWDGNNWAQLDRVQPAWDAAAPRTIALVAFGGTSVFEFDDFVLTVGP